MVKKIIPFFILFFLSIHMLGQKKKLFFGKTINRSVKIRPGTYTLTGSGSLDQPAIIITGDNITVDFNGAVIVGDSKNKMPDAFLGLAILVKGGKNITIKNLTVKGFKVAFLARDIEQLRVDHCDFSYNYRQHLNSTQEKEDMSDWMSYHHNEQDEWLRYGAALYLKNCLTPVITNCRVTGGQNALMMSGCRNGIIYNNDFSFNSGIGIGLYRSQLNTIAYNKVDFNVRGYSHGVYSRGQDSAGILVYEQSQQNHFYKNSATHGGDGFFLWAGQSTMDDGKGGCNDNLLNGNDFSYAPTNGIEATFSRNRIINNRVYECDYGFWGGYSYATTISANKFRNNKTDIAIEHGQQNTITYNIFDQGGEAIKLWANALQPGSWGYPKYRDTRSRDYVIALNSFFKKPTVFDIAQTENLNIFGNSYGEYEQLFKLDSAVKNLDTAFDAQLNAALSEDTKEEIPDIREPNDPFKGSGWLAGRKNIMMTAWGPYDFRYPICWNTRPTDTSGLLNFKIVGPNGNWKVRSFRGLEGLSKLEGGFPDSITARKIQSSVTDLALELEFTGETFTDPFGHEIKNGSPYPFSYQHFFLPIDFTVNWYSFDSLFHNPLKEQSLFPANARIRPIKTEKTRQLDYAWWGGIKAGKQYEQFITVGEGAAETEEGNYELAVTWDDAVRVFVDGKLIINEWNPSLYGFDESPQKKLVIHLAKGNHFFRVEHVELGGFAVLSLKINKQQ